MIITPVHRLPYPAEICFEDGLAPLAENSYVEREYADGIFVYTILNYHDKTNCLLKFDANDSSYGWPPE